MGSRKLSNCDFLKILSAPWGKRHCYGCSPTIVSLRLCRTFTTKNNSLNSPGRRNVRRSRSTIWQRSTNFIPATSESKKNHRSSREQWSCRRKPRRHRIRIVGQALGLPKCQRTATEAVALQFWRGLIRLVFFLHWLRAANLRLFGSASLLVADDLFTLDNFLEHISDHWRSSGTTMHLAANIALVNSRKRISRLVGRHKSGEPRCRALFVFWSPLRSAGFPCDFNIIEAGLMRRAACAIHDIDHSGAQLVQRLGCEVQRSFGAHLVGGHNSIIKCLLLLVGTGLVERSSV